MLQPAIIHVKPGAGYTLSLRYETGEERLFDASPYLGGAWFGELRDIAYFRAVRLARDGSGIEWPNGQDIAPHELYDLSVPQPRGKCRVASS
ncbi:MAG: DUF2442 domain-containing protein [Kiritimatiellaeota bacterium]|nr:DUF2442 domain-containing protein [Kiritimatiellota bacterium]